MPAYHLGGGRPALRAPACRSTCIGAAPRPLYGSARRAAAVAVRAQTPVQEQPIPVQPATMEQVPEAVAMPQQQYMQYPQQGIPRQEYYVPPPPVPYPTPPVYAKQESAGGIPWWVWMGAGILVANVARWVQELMQKGPQAVMAEMAMKQMMKGMGQGAPGAAGASPFGGAPGANPFAAAGANPFGPYGNQNPFAPNFQPPSAPVDTTATTVGTTPAAAATPTAATSVATSAPTSEGQRGEKFNSRVEAPTEEAKPAAAGAGSNGSTASSSSTEKVDVIEPEVKEPPKSKASSFFADVGADGSSSSSGGGSAGASSSGAGEAADPTQMTAMMEQMLRDPNMQKMLYPYLPEAMRNPDSIEWMLNNPEVRKQMESVFAQSNMGMSPQMMDMMKQMDFSQEKVQQQFSELGLKPEDVINKVLATPDLAAGFSNPKVQQAIFDISQNPMNITKYQGDPEVMAVLEKVTEIFGPQMQQQPGKQ